MDRQSYVVAIRRSMSDDETLHGRYDKNSTRNTAVYMIQC